MSRISKIFIYSFLLTITTICTNSVFAETYNSAGYWLEIIPDARASAMGGANTAIASSALATYWNPAGIYMENSWQSTYLGMMSGMQKYLSLAAAFPIPEGTFGASIMALSSDGIKQTIYQNGRPIETGTELNLLYALISTTYATEADGWHTGVTCRLLMHQLANETASGFGIDVGIKRNYGQWTIGGYKTFLPIILRWRNGTTEAIQSQTRIGVGYQPFKFLTIASDINLEQSSRPITIGMEFTLLNFAFRLGYGGSTALINAGMGMSFKDTEIDLSYSISEHAHISPEYRLSYSSKF